MPQVMQIGFLGAVLRPDLLIGAQPTQGAKPHTQVLGWVRHNIRVNASLFYKRVTWSKALRVAISPHPWGISASECGGWDLSE